jgi:hypothetical protein
VLFPDGPIGATGAEVQDYRLRHCPLTGAGGQDPSTYDGPTQDPNKFQENWPLGKDNNGNHGTSDPFNVVMKGGDTQRMTQDEYDQYLTASGATTSGLWGIGQ